MRMEPVIRIPRIRPRIFQASPRLLALAPQAIWTGLCLFAALALAGCAHEPPERGRAFTPEWTREIGAAQQNWRNAEDDNGDDAENNVIIGNEEGPRVEIEDGRPKIRMGQDGGLEAGVQSGTGRVGYRWEW